MYNKGGRTGTSFFILEKQYDSNNQHTGYKLLTKNTDTSKELSTATLEDASNVLGKYHITTKIDFEAGGKVKFDFKTYQTTEAFFDMLDKVAHIASDSGDSKNEKNIEGENIGDVSNGKYSVLAITYGSYDDDNSPTKLHTLAAIGSFTANSGSMEWSGDNPSSPTLTFESEAVPVDITIPSTLLKANTFNVSEEIKIKKGTQYFRKYLPLKTD